VQGRMAFGPERRLHDSERAVTRGRPQCDAQQTLGRTESAPATTSHWLTE